MGFAHNPHPLRGRKRGPTAHPTGIHQLFLPSLYKWAPLGPTCLPYFNQLFPPSFLFLPFPPSGERRGVVKSPNFPSNFPLRRKGKRKGLSSFPLLFPVHTTGISSVCPLSPEGGQGAYGRKGKERMKRKGKDKWTWKKEEN